MLQFLGRRLLTAIPVLFIVSIITYGLTALVPGDAAVTLAGGMFASEEAIEEVRSELGLDDPFIVQYVNWLSGAIRLDFGESLVTGDSVSEEIMERLPITLSLAIGAMAFGVIAGGIIGILAGVRAGTRLDRTLMFSTTMGIAVPNFLLAMLLIIVFVIRLGWFPAIGYTPITESPIGWLRTIALPSVALGTFVAASVARQLRSELADVMQRPYVRTAWAKGASPLRVVGKHGLKNAAIPAITVIGLQLGGLIGGTIIVEQIFSIPGMGAYLLAAIVGSDIPVILGLTTMFVLMYTAISIAVDIAYTMVNPKVRLA